MTMQLDIRVKIRMKNQLVRLRHNGFNMFMQQRLPRVSHQEKEGMIHIRNDALMCNRQISARGVFQPFIHC
ncbi:hypothetical protein D3C71_2165760 [compost metagenome]